MIGVEYDKWFDLAKKVAHEYVETSRATRVYLLAAEATSRLASEWYKNEIEAYEMLKRDKNR